MSAELCKVRNRVLNSPAAILGLRPTSIPYERFSFFPLLFSFFFVSCLRFHLGITCITKAHVPYVQRALTIESLSVTKGPFPFVRRGSGRVLFFSVFLPQRSTRVPSRTATDEHSHRPLTPKSIVHVIFRASEVLCTGRPISFDPRSDASVNHFNSERS